MSAKKEIDPIALIDVCEQGYTPRQAAEILNVSEYSLKKRIEELQKEQSVIMQYRPLHNVHLTQLKVKILESITDEDIERASLREKVQAYKILHDSELVDQGKPTEIKGLVGYLHKIEEERVAAMRFSDNKEKEEEEQPVTVNIYEKEPDI